MPRNHGDPAARNAKARLAFLARFARQVDPDGVLPPEDREQLIEAAMKAYFQELAPRGGAARSMALRRAQRRKTTGTMITTERIDAMTIAERIELLHWLRSQTDLLGAPNQWGNLEGGLRFLGDHGLAGPGTWMSWVNAGVLDSVTHGLRIVMFPDEAEHELSYNGAPEWAAYLEYLLGVATGSGCKDDEVECYLWSNAKEKSIDHGVTLARLHRLKPTQPEVTFLHFAQLHNWLLRNRPIRATIQRYLVGFVPQLTMITPAFVDRFMTTINDGGLTQAACEAAWTLANMDPGGMSNNLELITKIIQLINSGSQGDQE